jgi:hypothetical protein
MTTLRAIGLVARREFVERLRSKAFLAGNAFILILLIGLALLVTLLGRDEPTRVGVMVRMRQRWLPLPGAAGGIRGQVAGPAHRRAGCCRGGAA